MIKTVLFDLDGTLIGMDLDRFVKVYFDSVVDRLWSRLSTGLSRDQVYDGFNKAVFGMFKNDGSVTNEELFWRLVSKYLYAEKEEFETIINAYYEKDFVPEVISKTCERIDGVRELIDKVRSLGLTTALATNPAFPAVATHARVKFAGLAPEDFSLITTYENSHFVKPKAEYYMEILKSLSVSADECIMVGNDTSDDLSAEKVGIKVFILDKYLINKTGVDLKEIPHGGIPQLIEYLEKMNK